LAQERKILAIIGDSNLRQEVTGVLAEEKLKFEVASSKGQALELAKNGSFDLIICQSLLPGKVDGLSIIKTAKKTAQIYPKIIIISEKGEPALLLRAIKVKADDYIERPFPMQYLLYSVRRSLKILTMEEDYQNHLLQIKKEKSRTGRYKLALRKKIKEKREELDLLLKIGKDFVVSLRLDDVLNAIVDKIMDLLDVGRCSLLLYDDIAKELFIAASRGIPRDVVAKTRIKTGQYISGKVFAEGKPILVEDIEQDTRFFGGNKEWYYTKSFISVPLIFKGKTIGVINVNDKKSRAVFNRDEFRMIKGIADLATIAIENARLYSNFQEVYLQIINVLASTIEMKDHYTKGHSERVTLYALEIAKELNLSSKDRRTLSMACQLHDLGKIGIHEKILTKAGKLNEVEWQEMKMHPVRGAQILKPLRFMSDIMKLVEQHHEKYDGSGYPYGIKGSKIMLGARIMGVADSFDAMTTDRPYSPAIPPEEAVEEIESCSGTQFDPLVVKAFVKAWEKNPGAFQQQVD
jgi:putative nucleotidyltransferase with HDIG domain